MRSLWSAGLSLALGLAAGCTGVMPGSVPDPRIEPYLGVYRGSFDSALSEDPADDLNHNPCSPREGQDCRTHHQPLADILLTLRPESNGEVTLTFFQSREDLDAGRELDLLGRGCGTRLDSLASLESAGAGGDTHQVAVFPLTTDNHLCLGKLRPTSRHQVIVELHPASGDAGSRRIRVVIDKNVRDDNYLYVMDDGVRRRVKIDLDNTIDENHTDRYRVCIEDDFGEYERCVLTDREFRSFALPLPVPGGVALNYTWWQELRPRLQSTRGRYHVERYIGRFEPVVPPGS